jgi:DNA-directed RNA polymerase subunit RPC12/RpoP
MTEKLMVKCRHCGLANDLKMGRIYTIYRCTQCGGEINLDSTLTFELIPEKKPVKLIRDTVTVGFRPRRADDTVRCDACGSTSYVEMEDVLGVERTYKCSKCGKAFSSGTKEGADRSGKEPGEIKE